MITSLNGFNMKAIFGHIRNILVHKWWVFYYACKFGIPWRGFMHDWSKFHPTEFFESVKYYQGNSSPIPYCKLVNGVSYAWQHHKGHNPHHYEYWIDNFDKGYSKPTYHKIPYKYLMEMMADWFAAGRTYIGKDFTLQDEVAWWKWKREAIAMHPAAIEWIDQFMKDMEFWDDLIWVSDKHNQKVLKNRLKNLYERD